MSDIGYYLQDSRSTTGTNAMWWQKGGGYTSDLGKAELFTKEQALAQFNCRNTDIPFPVSFITGKCRLTVDCQYMDVNDSKEFASTGRYYGMSYLQKSRAWDGNDMYWMKEDLTFTTDVREAKIFSQSELLTYMPKSTHLLNIWGQLHVQSKTRLTIDVSLCKIENTGLAISIPKPVKERTRCDVCGRFITTHYVPCNNDKCTRVGG